MDRLSLPNCAVNAVARKLVAHGCWLVGDGFRGPPPETDLAFWREVASVAHASIALSAAPSQLFSALTLAAACRDELEVCDTSEIRPGTLYLSDIVSARSKLSCAILGIQGVLIVSAVPVAFDVATHVIDPSASLTDQLPAAITFARNLGGAALVCSHGANGMGAVVCAAVLAATEGLSSSVALAQVGMRRGLPLPVERDHEEELSAFCDAFLRAEFQLRLGEASPILTPKVVGKTKRSKVEASKSPVKRPASPPHMSMPKGKKRSAAHAGPPPSDFEGWNLDHGVDLAWHGGRGVEE